MPVETPIFSENPRQAGIEASLLKFMRQHPDGTAFDILRKEMNNLRFSDGKGGSEFTPPTDDEIRTAVDRLREVVAELSEFKFTEKESGNRWPSWFSRRDGDDPDPSPKAPGNQNRVAPEFVDDAQADIDYSRITQNEGDPMAVERNEVPEPIVDRPPERATNTTGDVEALRQQYTEAQAMKDMEVVQNAVLAVFKGLRRAEWRARTDQKLRAALWKVGGLASGLAVIVAAEVLSPDLAAAGGAAALGAVGVAGAAKLGSVVLPEAAHYIGRAVETTGKIVHGVFDIGAFVLALTGKGAEGAGRGLGRILEVPRSIKEFFNERAEKRAKEKAFQRINDLREKLRRVPEGKSVERAQLMNRIDLALEELSHLPGSDEASGGDVVRILAVNAREVMEDAQADLVVNSGEVEAAGAAIDRVVEELRGDAEAVDADTQAVQRFDNEIQQLNAQITEAREKGDKAEWRKLIGRKGSMMRWRSKRIDQYKTELSSNGGN